MSELKPCPFCGEKAHAIRHQRFYSVLCHGCGAQVKGGKTLSANDDRIKELAVTTWNTRATPPARWLKAEEVRESGSYWWTNEVSYATPVTVYVMKSGTDESCFASAGQLGWWKAMQMKELGGLWQRIPEPVLPEGE